ncbi:hypothetical protein LguiB_027342 [Lonicera macranthoides]
MEMMMNRWTQNNENGNQEDNNENEKIKRGAKVLSRCRKFGKGVNTGRLSSNQHASHPRFAHV